MRYVILPVAAWGLSVLVYLLSCLVFFGQTIGGGDLAAVLFWSFLAVCVAAPAAYYPCLFGLRRVLKGTEPVVAFPIAAVFLGIIPVLLIIFYFGGRLRDLVSPEAFLFCCMFGAFGVFFGIGFVLIQR